MQYLSLVGATLTLIAYFMVSNKKWAPMSARYQLTNLVSSCILGYVAVRYQNAGFMLLNFTWGAIGLWSLTYRARVWLIDQCVAWLTRRDNSVTYVDMHEN